MGGTSSKKDQKVTPIDKTNQARESPSTDTSQENEKDTSSRLAGSVSDDKKNQDVHEVDDALRSQNKSQTLPKVSSKMGGTSSKNDQKVTPIDKTNQASASPSTGTSQENEKDTSSRLAGSVSDDRKNQDVDEVDDTLRSQNNSQTIPKARVTGIVPSGDYEKHGKLPLIKGTKLHVTTNDNKLSHIYHVEEYDKINHDLDTSLGLLDSKDQATNNRTRSKPTENTSKSEIPNSSDEYKLRNTTTAYIDLKDEGSMSKKTHRDERRNNGDEILQMGKDEAPKKKEKKKKKKRKGMFSDSRNSAKNQVMHYSNSGTLSSVDGTKRTAWFSPTPNDSTTDSVISNYAREIAELRQENDELKTRLSKVMGDLVSNSNPNITDLSDQNRPLKTGERYREMYDNEWTDAFEDLELANFSGREAISTLLNILTNSYQECARIVEDEMKTLEQSVLAVTKCQEMTDDLKLNFKLYKDLRKKNYKAGIEPNEEFLRGLQPADVRLTPNLKKYILLAYELCWLMAIQDPPVVLFYKVTPGERFDTKYFREYTKTGTKCDYVVWPALLLQENGSVLHKGVMQGAM